VEFKNSIVNFYKGGLHLKIKISLFFVAATLFLTAPSSIYSQGQLTIIVNEEPKTTVSKTVIINNSPGRGHKYGHRKKLKKEELAQVLKLSNSQRVQFITIINNYESEYTRFHTSGDGGNKIQILINERDRKIRNLLNEDQYGVYLQFSLDF